MKRTLQLVGIGVVVGLGAVVVHEVLGSDEFKQAITETVQSVRHLVEDQKKKAAEKERLEPLRKHDPEANRAWVEAQWDEVLTQTT